MTPAEQQRAAEKVQRDMQKARSAQQGQHGPQPHAPSVREERGKNGYRGRLVFSVVGGNRPGK